MTKILKKITEIGNTDFDWSIYENGYTGANLALNPNVKVLSKRDKVYSQEAYASDLYGLYTKNQTAVIAPKDLIKGAVYNIISLYAVSSHEISVTMDSGSCEIIDMIKEHSFLEHIGCESVAKFMENIKSENYVEALLKTGIKGKVVDNDRISLSEGVKAGIEREFMREIRTNECKYAYNARIEGITSGGYIVDISGLKCFLPGSLAAAGIITDFESMLGKTVPVMVVNFIPKSGYVVSYKKYLNTIMPAKIQEELFVGKRISVKVTGGGRNCLFVIFRDKNGEYTFSGMIHRSVMSRDFEADFDRKMYIVNDEFWAYITAINEMEDGSYRIVLSDAAPSVEAMSAEENATDIKDTTED